MMRSLPCGNATISKCSDCAAGRAPSASGASAFVPWSCPSCATGKPGAAVTQSASRMPLCAAVGVAINPHVPNNGPTLLAHAGGVEMLTPHAAEGVSGFRLAAAEIQRGGEIDAGGGDYVVDQHMFAESMHGLAAGVRMQAAAGTEQHARHVIAGEMHRVGARPAQDGSVALAHDGALRPAQRIH